MTFIITDACIGSIDKSCIEVCPVDCIYSVGQDPEKPTEPYILVIDPVECIDCGACEPECPVEAIVYEDTLPEQFQGFLELGKMHEGRGDQSGPADEDAAAKADIAARALELHEQVQSAA